MRHQKVGRKLSRKVGPRTALLKNLADSLVLYEKVKTTEAKAKELRPYIERLVTVAGNNNLLARRLLISKLKTQNAVQKMLEVYGPKYKERSLRLGSLGSARDRSGPSGGYTRIVKIGTRKGDGAKLVQIEFV